MGLGWWRWGWGESGSAVRASCRQVGVSVHVRTVGKWFAGKPTPEAWVEVNGTLRRMSPEVHELDKRKEAHFSPLQGYPSTYGNACDVWKIHLQSC